MRRLEFTRVTKREAYARSEGRCEATGRPYGFRARHRCGAPLGFGVEYDHYPIRAADGGPNTLDNCVAVCVKCHRWKTLRFHFPALAKDRRIQDKSRGINERYCFATNRNGPLKRKIDGTVVVRLRRKLAM